MPPRHGRSRHAATRHADRRAAGGRSAGRRSAGHRRAAGQQAGWSTALGVVGEIAITAGVILVLFVVYTLWGTGIQAAQAQDRLRDDFDASMQPTSKPDEKDDKTGIDPDDIKLGDAYALLKVPRFGEDWAWTVVQGTKADDLKNGPGHYIDSANPGEVGNFSVAGHRSGHGEPFAQFPELRVGDRIEVINSEGTFIYELDEAPDGDPDGNRIDIGDVWVVDPVPGEDSAEATERRITLTTCWPRFGSTHRMYATGTLVEGPEL